MYEALTEKDINLILNTSNISTLFLTPNNIEKISKLKLNNEIPKLKNLVILGGISISDKKKAEELGFNVFRYEEILFEGKSNPA